MKKLFVLMTAMGLTASAFAGCGSGCFNNCQSPPCNPGGSGCGIQGVPPDVRDYRANPNQGVYSTGEGLPAQAPGGGQNLKQGAWQNNNPAARSIENDRKLYTDLQNQLKGYNLSITVNHGVVTLQGRVSSEEEKKALGDKVNSMPAVKRLNNQLEVWNQNTNPWQQQQQRNY